MYGKMQESGLTEIISFLGTSVAAAAAVLEESWLN